MAGPHQINFKLTQSSENAGSPKNLTAEGWKEQETAHSAAEVVLERI